MSPPARRMALEALRLCLDQGRDVQDALHRALAATPGAKPADNALATELTYGYLRYKGRLDALLDTLLAAPKRTSSAMRRILGVAAYEILFLDRIPAYAGVDWAVTLARKRLGRTVGNVTNAVLRNLIRLGDAPFQEDYFRSRAADDAAFLSAWYSCPLRLVRMWLNAYGREQTKSFLQASLALPPHGLRINRRHTQAAALRERSAPSAVASSSWGLALTHWPEFLDAAVEGGKPRQALRLRLSWAI